MKSLKKILSLSVCVLLVLTLMPAAALAVETFTTSDEGIDLIEEYEGFREEPYMDDNGNWYIGYGTSCDPEDYPDGISKRKAERLLEEALVISPLRDKQYVSTVI